jgi:CRP-like cAMP-binding protein
MIPYNCRFVDMGKSTLIVAFATPLRYNLYESNGGDLMDKKVLSKCILFQELDEGQLEYALEFFEAEKKFYPRGSFLNRISAPLTRFGLVLSGTVRVYRDDVNGHHMILANVSAGGTFGESLCWLGRDTDVYICAVTDAELLWLRVNNLRNPARNSEPNAILLRERFISMLASRALDMNDRIQILSQTTIRAKLIAFFSQYVTRGGSDCFEVPFDRGSMAHYLGTDRSALSRELGRMRDEGLIEFSGSRFCLKGMLSSS